MLSFKVTTHSFMNTLQTWNVAPCGTTWCSLVYPKTYKRVQQPPTQPPWKHRNNPVRTRKWLPQLKVVHQKWLSSAKPFSRSQMLNLKLKLNEPIEWVPHIMAGSALLCVSSLILIPKYVLRVSRDLLTSKALHSMLSTSFHKRSISVGMRLYRRWWKLALKVNERI